MTDPKDIVEIIESAGGDITDGALLPDGSGFITASFPLPESHWIYGEKKGYEAPPMPFRMGTDDGRREEFNKAVWAAAKYAIRASTMKGKEMDFDPDALCQNMVVGLLGYHTEDGLSSLEDWANPNPVPPAFPDTFKS